VEGALRLESRKYLGASYVFLGRRQDAEQQFAALIREDPQHELDPIAFPRDVIELFTSVRERVEEERRLERERQQRDEAARRQREIERVIRERERLMRLQELASRQVIERENSRFVALIPFGVGQFQNQDPELGWVFAVSGGVFGLASLVTGIWHIQLNQQLASAFGELDAATIDETRFQLRTLRILNQIAFGLFAAIGLASIIDAQARFVPVVSEVREREIDDLDHTDSPGAESSNTPDEQSPNEDMPIGDPFEDRPTPDLSFGLVPYGTADAVGADLVLRF
jgi:hypothetical protein